MEALRRHDANRERGGQTDRNGTQNGGESDEEVTFRAVNEPLCDSGSIAGSLTPSDVEGDTESESVSLMRLKLALVKEERRRERERVERAREMKQLEWQIERDRNEMLAGQTTLQFVR